MSADPIPDLRRSFFCDRSKASRVSVMMSAAALSSFAGFQAARAQDVAPATGAEGKHDLLVPTGDGVREPQNRRVTIVYSGDVPTS